MCRCAHCSSALKLGTYASLEGKYYCKPHFRQVSYVSWCINILALESHSVNILSFLPLSYSKKKETIHQDLELTLQSKDGKNNMASLLLLPLLPLVPGKLLLSHSSFRLCLWCRVSHSIRMVLDKQTFC